jgi:endonuclease G
MKSTAARSSPRTDVVHTQDDALAKAVWKQRGGKVRQAAAQRTPDAERLMLRQDFAEDPSSDPNGYERILGKSDLSSINFLERGRRAAAAVCRIKLPMEAGGTGFGTAFLVGTRLLLTNHHVLSSKAEAGQAEAEFGYEHDLDGVLSEPVQFNLRPDEVFYTNAELDITFVAVAPLSQNGVPLDRYGKLTLMPISGKALPGEWVSIIQHPHGQPKQIAIQASEVLALNRRDAPRVNLQSFIHYTTDTEPGSSGSPVFNDQWQVVALHHKAVPAPESVRRRAKGRVEWIANEGVRVSAIFKHLERRRFEDDSAHLVLDRLAAALGLPPATRSASSVEYGEQYSPYKIERWNDPDLGYD